MKVKIHEDELYPYFQINGNYGEQMDIPKNIVEDYVAAKRLFEKAHARLLKYIRNKE